MDIREIVGQFPSAVEFAKAVSTPRDRVETYSVRRWVDRNSVPAKYWGSIIDACNGVDFLICADDLVKIHDIRLR